MHIRSLLLLCALSSPVFSALFGLIELGSPQSAAATGKLICNGKPYKNARIKFWEVDIGMPDDLMMEAYSDEHGVFNVSGTQNETGWITPKVSILHNCNDEDVECWRKVSFTIPQSDITLAETPDKVFDIGTLNLDAVMSGETRDCVN